jgi:hypothetical protein
MGAHVVALQTKKARLDAARAEELRQGILSLDGLPEPLVTNFFAALDSHTAATNGWTFVMISAEQFDRVHDWLLENSKRPVVAVRLWSKLFRNMARSGYVAATREELAEAVGIRPAEVSAVMSELESINAISRARMKVPGMRGPGTVHYRVNSHVGTHLTGAARDKAQAEDGPLIRLVEG